MFKEDSLAIAAIFRDEFDYLLEWFAWHQIAGFKNFFIADNGSTDGTVALLEAFEDIGMVQLVYQPVITKRAQILAYERLVQRAIANGIVALLFIDGDEFLVHDSMIDGEEYRSLDALLDYPDIAMVGINWRTFGSSGHKLQTDEPVIQRFYQFCNNAEKSVNGYFKSISKIALANSVSVHEGHFPSGYRLVDSLGCNLNGFISNASGVAAPVKYSGVLRTVIEGPLRINHYIIKSEQEFIEKKRRRGSAMRGINVDKGEHYFSQHDFTDANFIFPESKIKRLKLEMEYLRQLLSVTTFVRKLTGVLDISNSSELRGWLVDENKQSSGLKVNIFVNDLWQGQVSCGFYRPGLKDRNISATGLSGFRYTHPKPLAPGDVVEVKVHANRYVFPKLSRIIID